MGLGVWLREPVERVDMSWTPTEKSERRRVGRGSRGRRSETEEGMPERMEISYTAEPCQHSGRAVEITAYQNYKLAQPVPDLRAVFFSVITPLCRGEI